MTGKLKICNFGKNMLQIFYVTTLLAAIYLILGFCGFYERWFANGPAGITVEKKYWLIRLCILDWNDQRVSDITAAGNPLACVGAYMWLDSDCASGDAAYHYPDGKTGSKVREAACEAKCCAGR